MSAIDNWHLDSMTFTPRWCDDQLQVWDYDIPLSGREVVEEMMTEDFYGEPLVLEDQGGADESFGSIVSVAGGVLWLRPVQHFGKEEETPTRAKKTRPAIQAGTQYGPDWRKTAAVVGRLVRTLDMCNEEGEVVQRLVVRLTLELFLQGSKDSLLLGALRRVEENAWVSLRPARRILNLSEKRKQEVADSLDDLQDQERKLDAELALREWHEARKGRRQ